MVNCFAKPGQPGGAPGQEPEAHNLEICHSFAMGAYFTKDPKRREAYLTSRGWRVIRFQNWEVYEHLEMVMDGICRYAPEEVPLRRCAPPPP